MSVPTFPDEPADPFRVSSGDSDKSARLPDLPQVEPPSAGFVIQLFVIPAAVVVVVIIVWLLFGKLAGGERDATEYVRQLRSPTANWRLAFELASLIQHDPKIGSDSLLLGELSDLLSHGLDQPDADPQLTQYLALSLGAFRTLEARTASGQMVDPLGPLERALAGKYPVSIRLAAAASLAKQAARLDGKLDDAQAVRALGEAAGTGEPEVQFMRSGSSEVTQPQSSCGTASSRMKIGLSGSTPRWRSAGGVILRRSPLCGRCYLHET
jgi:hypothetical protein